MKIIVVGERMNVPTLRPQCWPDVACDHYYRLMLRLGAFRDQTSYRKLRSVGLDLESPGLETVNLLPLDPQNIPWDARKAKEVAEAWLPRLRDGFDLAVLCGRRVADAFSVDVLGKLEDCVGTPVALDGMDAVLLPHPSRLNRWWNDRTNVGGLRTRLREILTCRT